MVAPAAIVLAAGEGRRMGGPKALLVVDGQPLVRRHVDRLSEVGCDPIVVVVRPAIADRARAVLADRPRVRLVAADTVSPASSLAMGLRSLTIEDDTTVIVTPVDMIPAAPSTVGALLSAAGDEGAHVATPRHRGRGGHPVVLRAPLLRVFLDGYRGTLRDLVRSAGGRRRQVDVDDAAVGGDLDTPADLDALRAGAVVCSGSRR